MLTNCHIVSVLCYAALCHAVQALQEKLSANKQQEAAEEGEGKDVGFGRLLALNRPERPFCLLGLCCALVVGLQVGRGVRHT